MQKRLFYLAGVIIAVLLIPYLTFAATVGEQTLFNVDSVYDSSGRSSISATLRVEGENAHYYVEDGYWQALGDDQASFLQNIQDLSREFDTRIYPLEHQGFGSEPNPGIDGDPKITVVITPLVAEAGGYFLLGNGFSKSRNKDSNEREMVYISADLNKVSRWPMLLTHEFQHLVTFGAKEIRINRNEEVWLNELRSEYAITLLGYDDRAGVTNLIQRARSFLRQPSDALLAWQNQNADYGLADVFAQYLTETYGTKILRETIEANGIGIAAIEEALRKRGIAISFADVYANWVKADFTGGYRHPALQNLRLTPSITYNVSAAAPMQVQNSTESWSLQSVGVQSTDPGLEIGLSGGPNESWLLMVIKKNDSTASPLSYQFTGSKTVSFPINNPDDGNLVVVAVDTTDRTAPRDEAVRSAPYTLSMRGLNEAPAPAPTPLLAPAVSATPTATPSPSPEPTPIPSPSPPPRVSFPDGTLIRERGDTRVWIVSGSTGLTAGGPYIRQIAHPLIFTFYLHLKWENVREVERGTIAQFQISTLMRASGDTKVYEVDAAGAKRWLNMTPEQFTASGRRWEAVYIINDRERDFYPVG